MAELILTEAEAYSLAELPLEGICREYPNKLDHLINGPHDLLSPRELHPSFYGCYDWHSAVHGHWSLIRLLRMFKLSKEAEIRDRLRENLSRDNLATETAYLSQPNRGSFERPYGWGWLLKLAAELHNWDDDDGRTWRESIRPLEAAFVKRFREFLPKQTYAIRSGVHSNTAFSLILALDYANAVGDNDLISVIKDSALSYFAADKAAPVHWEPSGADFLSPSLTEAALLSMVGMPDFASWLHRFIPDLTTYEPALVSDRTDPQIGHLDGLNLSRAWCMRKIAAHLPEGDGRREQLLQSAEVHLTSAQVRTGDYGGEHWLASFALLAWTGC